MPHRTTVRVLYQKSGNREVPFTQQRTSHHMQLGPHFSVLQRIHCQFHDLLISFPQIPKLQTARPSNEAGMSIVWSSKDCGPG